MAAIVATPRRRHGANWRLNGHLFAAFATLKSSNNRFHSRAMPCPSRTEDHMDNAVTINPHLPLVEPAGFGARMASLPMRSKLSLALGVAALAAVVLP